MRGAEDRVKNFPAYASDGTPYTDTPPPFPFRTNWIWQAGSGLLAGTTSGIVAALIRLDRFCLSCLVWLVWFGQSG